MSGPIEITQDTVLGWFQTAERDLPWRRTRDPWAVLVSELMLQQTQVARVIPKYIAFLDRFPDPAACAAAPTGAVVQAWAGLGYNRRAVNLHRAAVAVIDRHDGRLPGTLDELLTLPGIGPYTARAVLAFAFERPAAVVDTNVARVLARAVAGRRLTGGEAQALADRLLPFGRTWAWNQAMLDLGAVVCTSRSPQCHVCPLAATGGCAWVGAGRPAPDPAGTTSRQSAFAGSDRQGRGRLVAALRRGPIARDRLAQAAGWPEDPARAAAAAAALVADGLAADTDDGLALP
jgi:A/G-specific adenine glycosylase